MKSAENTRNEPEPYTLESMGLPTGFGVKQKPKTKKNITVKDISVSTKSTEMEASPKGEPSLESQPVSVENEDQVLIDVIPSLKCTMTSHSRAVTALTIDPKCARLLSGSRDHFINFWDFGGMISTLKPFRGIEPNEGNLIRDLAWSNSGDSFLVAPSTSTPKLFDREGVEVCLFSRGDMYIRDLRNVFGHTSGLTSIGWIPHKTHTFYSTSLDSTLRIWDIEHRTKSIEHHFLPASRPGDRYALNSSSCSGDGKRIVVGDQKGRILLWDVDGNMTRPVAQVNGHKQEVLCSVKLSLDNHSIISRSMDETMKSWDLRKFDSPIGTVQDLPTLYEEQNCIFSPNEKWAITGLQNSKTGPSTVNFYSKHDLALVKQLQIPSAAVRLLWPSKINQLFCGLSNGDIQVYYNSYSRNGVLAALSKVKSVKVEDYHLLLGGLDQQGEIDDKDPYRSEEEEEWETGFTARREATKPHMPYAITGPGKDGTLGTNLTKHLMKNMLKNKIRDEDPREAILKHAEGAKNDPYWVQPAYKNQKKNILADQVYEDEIELLRDQKKKRKMPEKK